MSAPKDPLDALLGELMPAEAATDVRAQAERAFLNHAQESKKSSALAWRFWSRWLEPSLVGIFVLIFVVWAFVRVLGG